MTKALVVLLAVVFPILAVACAQRPAGTPGMSGTRTSTPIVAAARQQVGVTTGYDPAYISLEYPGGDVPLRTGVCSDVVIRALRRVGIDLQKEVHEDMRRNFGAYPRKWGLRRPDRNIDHRRVPNLMRYFERHHLTLAKPAGKPEAYAPGDIVAWDLGNGLTHIGIVSDRMSGRTPLIIHNIGGGARDEDILFRFHIIGHYRIKGTVRSVHPAR